MRVRGLVILGLVVLVTHPGNAQSRDATLIATARYALDKGHDCSIAKESLYKMSEGARKALPWIYLAAQTHECLKEYDMAEALYSEYNDSVPGHPEVIAKIGEMNFYLEQAKRHAAEDDARVADSAKRASERKALQEKNERNEEAASAREHTRAFLSTIAGSWSGDDPVLHITYQFRITAQGYPKFVEQTSHGSFVWLPHKCSVEKRTLTCDQLVEPNGSTTDGTFSVQLMDNGSLSGILSGKTDSAIFDLSR